MNSIGWVEKLSLKMPGLHIDIVIGADQGKIKANHKEHLEKLAKDLESVLIDGIYIEDDGSVTEITPEDYFEGQILSDYIRDTDGKRIWLMSTDHLMLNLTDGQYEYGDDTVRLNYRCAEALRKFAEETDNY